MQTLTETRAAVSICLETDCPNCDGILAANTLRQMNVPKYRSEMAVLPLDRSYDAYIDSLRTGRRRTIKAARMGYSVRLFERADYQDDMHAINTSRQHRQGRPMDAGYTERVMYGPLGDQPCGRHRYNVYGVFTERGRLVGYSVVHRVGELALISQILGHGEFEPDGIMQLLATEIYRLEEPQGGFLFYNDWKSGVVNDAGLRGLQQAKEWVGFRPAEITWAP